MAARGRDGEIAEGRPPRIMQVALSLSPGGTERLVIEIALRLSGRFPMQVCCLDEPGAWAGQLRDAGIAVASLGRRPGFHASIARAIARIVREQEIDVLHCHHYSPFVYGALSSLIARRVRVIYTEHGRLSDRPESAKRQLVNPLLGRLPFATCAVSQDLKRHMVASGFRGAAVRVIYNGIAVSPTPTGADRAHARECLGVGADAFVVGTVARLDPVKDLATLVAAFTTFTPPDSKACLAIIGDGPLRAELEHSAGTALQSGRIRFLGHRDDARALLPGFDAFVNSSVTEGVSLTILEAMAAELPVIATRVGGTPEVVLDGTTGLLVEPRAPHALAGALAELARDGNRRRDMGLAGRARVEAEFTIGRMVDAYAALYAAAEAN
jgi:glycosyltransferase involved in cell wall biosynthesis